MTIVDREFKQGDLEPPLEARLTQAGGTSTIDLSTALRVELRMTHQRKSSVRVVGDCVFIDRVRGHLRYLWLDGDTEVPGVYNAVFVIYWAGDRPQTVPSGGYKEIEIERQI